VPEGSTLGSPPRARGWPWASKARKRVSVAALEAVLARLAWQVAELRAGLDRIAAANAAMAAELRE
jgi:predicted transcriptional regulator